MKLLEDRIRRDGRILGTEVLKVDSFLNHQIDPELMAAIGKEFARLFADKKIDKILTVESSGIAPAVFTGLSLHVPVVFARKNKSLTLPDDVWTADVYSFTKEITNHIMIDHRFLAAGENILLIDDFWLMDKQLKDYYRLHNKLKQRLLVLALLLKKHFKKVGNY